jgi:diaminopimelate epimerase
VDAQPFDKYEGLGNDFVLVEAESDASVTTAQAVEICDRRRGVGADGVLVVLPASRGSAGVARMRVINADGSIPEMCGNGVRCVALHLARVRGLRGGTLTIETDAGPRECTLELADASGGEGVVTVDMGVVRVDGERSIDADGQRVSVTLADAGNPHAVLFGAFARSDVDRLGPFIATHPSFQNGTNVEFAQPAADGGIDVVVWERGVGVTLACGTGACATAAVACARGLAKRACPLSIRLPGGKLEVTVAADGRAVMRGPARHVFSGRLDSRGRDPAPIAPGPRRG